MTDSWSDEEFEIRIVTRFDGYPWSKLTILKMFDFSLSPKIYTFSLRIKDLTIIFNHDLKEFNGFFFLNKVLSLINFLLSLISYCNLLSLIE